LIIVPSIERTQMKSTYDAIVIGTGFGGAVAACRLAQAQLSVGVLERGRRYDTNQFPRNWNNPADGWLWQVKQGLFDVKHFSQMMVIEGAGLGGGSLIYANVHLRAPQEVFNHGWPTGYSRAALDTYYNLVAYMLDIRPITASTHFREKLPDSAGLPPKTLLMKKMADAMGRSDQFCYPNIAVDFNEPNTIHLNKFGAEQRGCTYCGECDIGCNVHAKNTLDFNYLKVARDQGAEIYTQCEATQIEEAPGGYQVTFKDHTAGGQLNRVEAKWVFVCGGAVNSTELLLRCRDQYGKLPKLSRQLGTHYSGNGDFLAFAFNSAEPFVPSCGPIITTGIVYSRKDGNADNWFIFEEGGYPKEISALLQVLNPAHGILEDVAGVVRADVERLLRRSASPPGLHADADRSAIFLAMGRDQADGVISLHPLTKALDIEWNMTSNRPLYVAEEGFSRALAQKMGATPAFNPFWRLVDLPVSVHNLGGCPLGDDRAIGVVDANGEVFDYPGLFVLDGAAIPVAIGANPSHTIAAVAERNVERAIRKYTGKKTWTAPEGAFAAPIDDPLSAVKIPQGGVLAL
jgi:cholesterol oxidase